VCARKTNDTIGRGRGYRYGLPNQEYYFKTGEEMKKLLLTCRSDLELLEIVDKIEIYNLAREVLLPKFDIQRSFRCRRYC
jgi:DNA polymerase-3 subunit alpha